VPDRCDLAVDDASNPSTAHALLLGAHPKTVARREPEDPVSRGSGSGLVMAPLPTQAS
jgi:hypothetical protein